MGIKDRITKITWERKIGRKDHHIESVQAKDDQMLHQIKFFNDLFIELFHKGLSCFWDEDGKLISQSNYQALLVQARMDHKKFQDMAQGFIRKLIIEKLAVDFEILNQIRIIGAKLSPISYVDHVESRVFVKKMTSHEVPSGYQWKTIEKFGRVKYKLHQ